MTSNDPYGTPGHDPESEQPTSSQQPGMDQPGFGGQPPPGYGQPSYPPNQGGQPGWTPQSGYNYPPGQPGYYPQQHQFGGPTLPPHPSAHTSMILGIVGLAGTFVCLIPIVLSPFAWYLGAKARREIDAAPNQWDGRGEAQAGFVTGIIGTALLILGVAIVAIIIVIAIGVGTAVSTSDPYAAT